MLKEFKKFLLRGNMIDLAVGVVIGAAFNTVITAVTTDFLSPFISFITRAPNLNGLSFGLNGIQFMYGHFLNTLISFILVSAIIFFFVVKPMNVLMSKSGKGEPATKKCSECLSEIPRTAHRCAHCAQVVS